MIITGVISYFIGFGLLTYFFGWKMTIPFIFILGGVNLIMQAKLYALAFMLKETLEIMEKRLLEREEKFITFVR